MTFLHSELFWLHPSIIYLSLSLPFTPFVWISLLLSGSGHSIRCSCSWFAGSWGSPVVPRRAPWRQRIRHCQRRQRSQILGLHGMPCSVYCQAHHHSCQACGTRSRLSTPLSHLSPTSFPSCSYKLFDHDNNLNHDHNDHNYNNNHNHNHNHNRWCLQVETGGVLGVNLARQLKMTQDAMCVRYSNTKSQVGGWWWFTPDRGL